MKKTKLYAKKTLSVFMAVMMLMTAWVFVAPEKAEAATAGRYYIKYVVNVTNTGTEKDNNFRISYKTNNGQGTQYTDVMLQDADKYDWSGNNVTVWEGYIDGFPTQTWHHYAFNMNTRTERHENIRLFVGKDASSLSSSSVLQTSGNNWTYKNSAQDCRMDVVSGTPYQNSITGMSSLSLTVNKNGSGQSSTTTGVVYDQYGVSWYQAPSYSISSSSSSQVNVGDISAVASGDGAYAKVSGLAGVFKSDYGYSTSTGKVTLYMRATSGGASASVPVTITAPKFTLKFNKQDGTTVYSNDLYYKSAVDCASIASGLANSVTQIADNNQQHQTYVWDTTKYVTSLTADTVVTEVVDKLVDHTYGAWTQNENDHTRTCSTCGYVQTQEHKNGEGYITKAETCTEDGVMTYDCAVCGKKAIETSKIDNITGHDFSGAVVENATGENGNHWKKCSRCDAYGWAGVENNCEDHNWDKNGNGTVDATDATSSKASTCKEKGYETYTCKVCSATWTKTLDLAAHKTNKTAAKDATNICGGDGNEAFWTCEVCNRVWKDEALTDELTDTTDADSDGIPDALETKGPDHEFTGVYVSASSGKDGTHYRQCARFTQCKTYGPEEKHTWGDPAVTEATCEKTGKRVYTCTSGCGQTYEETIDKVAHSMTKHGAVEAKCGVAGSIEYYSCSICGKNYDDEKGTNVVESIVIPALEHKWTVHHDYDTLVSAATCMSPAVYNNHCDYCKVQLQSTHEYGTPDTVNGHNFNGTTRKNDDGTHSYKCTVEGCPEYGKPTECEYVVTEDVASTCKTRGYTTYDCKYCDNGYSDTKALDPLNHTGEGTYIIANQEPTCATYGSTGIEKCSGCNATLSTKLNDIPVNPDNHEDMKLYEAKTSTCQEEGWKEYKYCSACNTYEIEKVTVAKKEHKFTKYTSNNDGTHTATCDTCDATVATPVTDTKDCEGGTANCVEKAVCTVCDGSYGSVDSTNHKTVKTAAKVDSTCQKEGTEAYRYCEACGNDIETRVAIEKKDHIFGAWTKVDGEDKHTRSCTTCNADVADVATETADCNGGIAYCNALAKCADCKAEYGDYNKDNHSTEANTLKGKVDATCQAPGYTGDYHYNCCDAIKEQGTATEQLAHTFSIEVEGSRVAATCIAEGEVTYKCSTCDPDVAEPATEKKVLPIDAKNHATPDKTVTIGAKDATCEEDGHTGDVYYECCYDPDASAAENKKALKEKGTTIKANGQHVYDAAVPEYMIAEIRDVKDEDGNVTGKEIVLKDTEPAYADKIKARRDDDKWYHAKQCTVCGTIEYEACYTYEHTYSCVDTDTCEVCEGLCSLKDPDKHTNIVKVPKVEATHTTDGTKEYYKCEDCGKFFLDEAGKKPFDPASDEGKELIKISKDTVPCTEWEKDPFETVEPKCGQDGYKKYHCAVEGCDKVKTEVIPAESDSHTWSEDYKVIKEPTCGAVGYKTLYCTVCGEYKPNSTVTISATGEHSYKLVDTDKGTSCLDPTIEIYECEVCGAEKTETVYDGDANHNWGEWEAVGGDCSTGIIQQRECSVCHEKQQQTVTTDTHDYELTTRVEPTPEADGYVIYTCKNCGAEKREELPYSGSGEGGTETDHKHLIDENNYTVAKEASCDHGEIRRYVCLRCGETVEKEIEGTLLDHVWLEQAEEKATCAKDGHSAYYRCVRCLAEYGEGKEIYPATGHKDGNGDGKCDSCNSAFYEDGNGSKTCGCICHKEGFLMKIIYKIVRFFWKLFKIGHSCDCGAVHY